MAQYLDKAGLTTLWTKIKNTFALKKHTHKKSEITDLTIPTVNNPTITINQGGVKKGSFSLNQSGAATIDLTDDNTTYSVATQSADGLMSAADKKKLEGIADGANKITVDSALSSTSTNPVQNKVINSALDNKQPKGNYVTTDTAQTITGDKTFNTIRTNSNIIVDDTNNDTHTYYQDKKILYISYDSDGDIVEDYTYTLPNKTGVLATTDDLNNITVDSSLSPTSTNPVQNKVIKSALDGKQAKGDYATNDTLKSYVTGTTFINYTTYIEGEVNKKANASHDHDISDINGLQSALDGKSNTGHGHTISNITNLQSTIESIYSDMGLQDEAIAGKSDVGHTHKKSDITDLSIPTVNNPTITINQGGTKKGSFTLNQSGATTIDLTDNNTTYTAGAGLDLSNGVFSVKTGYTTNGKNYKVTTDNSGNLYVSVPWNNDTWRPVVDNLTTTDATKSLSANQGKVLKDLVDGKLNDYGSDTSRPGGTSFTFPSGSNPVQMRSGNKNAGQDIGIFRLTDDNAFICNSSDNGYAFAVFDTDKTADFSTASNAAFAVLSEHAGVSVKGGLSVDGKAVSLDGHTHSKSEVGLGNVDNTADANKNVNYATSAGDADTLDGHHASSFARIAADNNLMYHTDEFTFASSGFSGAIWLNYRTAGGTNGNITEYKLGNGAGGQLGTIIHSGNIGSQSVNYANSAGSANSVAWGNVSGRPTSLPASNISMSSDGTTLTITYS